MWPFTKEPEKKPEIIMTNKDELPVRYGVCYYRNIDDLKGGIMDVEIIKTRRAYGDEIKSFPASKEAYDFLFKHESLIGNIIQSNGCLATYALGEKIRREIAKVEGLE